MSVLSKLRARFGTRKMRKAEALRERKMAESRSEFDRLKAECGPDQMVCGTILSSGQPVYFLAPRDAPDPQIDDLAFQRRHGRAQTKGELYLAVKAKQLTVRGSGE